MALLRQCRLFYTEAGRGNFSMTDLLQKAAKTYREICKKQYRYTLNNGQCVHIVFRPEVERSIRVSAAILRRKYLSKYSARGYYYVRPAKKHSF